MMHLIPAAVGGLVCAAIITLAPIAIERFAFDCESFTWTQEQAVEVQAYCEVKLENAARAKW